MEEHLHIHHADPPKPAARAANTANATKKDEGGGVRVAVAVAGAGAQTGASATARYVSLDAMRREMDGLVDRMTGLWRALPGLSARDDDNYDPFSALMTPVEAAPQDLAPLIDASETEDAYTISAELPGVLEQDVQLSLKDGALELAGIKRDPTGADAGVHVAERSFGAFHRVFRLPRDVDADRIAARFERGVLAITLPKRAGGTARKIAIVSK